VLRLDGALDTVHILCQCSKPTLPPFSQVLGAMVGKGIVLVKIENPNANGQYPKRCRANAVQSLYKVHGASQGAAPIEKLRTLRGSLKTNEHPKSCPPAKANQIPHYPKQAPNPALAPNWEARRIGYIKTIQLSQNNRLDDCEALTDPVFKI